MTTPLVVPQSPMGLGDVFGTTFSILKRRFRQLAGIALVQQLVTLVLFVPVILFVMLVLVPQISFSSSTLSSGYLATSAVGTALGIVMAIVATVVSLYFLGLLVHAVNQALLNKNPSLADLRTLNRGTVRRLGPVYAVALLSYYVLLGLGMLPMLSVLPGLMSASITNGPMPPDFAVSFLGAWALEMLTILVLSVGSGILLVKAAYINQVGTVEGLGWMAAVKRAFALTKGSFWRTAGYLIVMAIAVGVIEEGVGMIAEVVLFASSSSMFTSGPQAMLSSGVLWLFYGVVYALVLIMQIVLVPFQQAYVTVMYVDQIRRIRQGPVVRPMPGQYGQRFYYANPQQPQGWTQPGVPPQSPPWPQQGVPQQPPRWSPQRVAEQPPVVPTSPSDDGPPA